MEDYENPFENPFWRNWPSGLKPLVPFVVVLMLAASLLMFVVPFAGAYGLAWLVNKGLNALNASPGLVDFGTVIIGFAGFISAYGFITWLNTQAN